MSTIDPMSHDVRSQSPNLINPMIQIKYETNNYYPQVPHSPSINNELSTLSPYMNSPKTNQTSNILIDGSVFHERNNGLMSPQHSKKKSVVVDFYNNNVERVASPVPAINKINFVNKVPLITRNKKKSNTFKLKKDQE